MDRKETRNDMEFKGDESQGGGVLVSERALAHHTRYFGTVGFVGEDGKPRVPTEQEVVAMGWEPESYLTDPIPTTPRSGVCGLGKTRLGSQ